MKKALAGLSLSAAVLFMAAAPAEAHGDRPDATCTDETGVHGATRGRYGAGTPWVNTGDPVPLTRNGAALTGVGGGSGANEWDSPFAQVPECESEPTTTTTRPASTTSTTSTSTTSTTGHTNGEDTTTTTQVSGTSSSFTGCAYNGEPIPCGDTTPTTTCEEDMPCFECESMGNEVCPHSNTGQSLPETGAPIGAVALAGAGILSAGLWTVHRTRRQEA